MDQFVRNGIAENFMDLASLLAEDQLQGLAIKTCYTAGNGGTGFIQDFDKVTLVKMLLYREHTNGKQAGMFFAKGLGATLVHHDAPARRGDKAKPALTAVLEPAKKVPTAFSRTT